MSEFIRFVIVGAINTVLNAALIFTLYNVAHMGYWGSSATGYIIVTFISYFMNRNYTFRYKGNVLVSMAKFFGVIACCYLLSYYVARPLTRLVLAAMGLGLSVHITEQIAMLVGMAGCMLLNFFCQKLFVFRKQGITAPAHRR